LSKDLTEVSIGKSTTGKFYRMKVSNMENTSSTSLKSKLEERKANFELKADDNKKRAYVDILWQPLRNY